MGILFAPLFPELWPPLLCLFLAFVLLGSAFLLLSRQSYDRRWWYGLLMFLFFICIGLYHRLTYPDHAHSDFIGKLDLSEGDALLVELVEELHLTSSGRALKVLCRCVAVKEKKCRGRLLLYFSLRDGVDFDVGDLLLIPAVFEEIPGPGVPHVFDYRAYMAGRQVYFQAFVRSGDFVLVGHVFRFWHIPLRFRGRLLRVLRKHMEEGEALAVVGAMVLGERRQMDRDVKELYARTGAMHVLAVSGLHMGLIYFFLLWVFRKVPLGIRHRQGFHFFMGLFGLWGFALLTGASPSALRAAVLFSFLLGGRWIGQRSNAFNALAASAFCLLWYNPLWLGDLSFQLSYSAILGILLFQQGVFACWAPPSVLLLRVWKLISVSVAAQLSTAPLSLYHFHRFSNGFWLSSLLVVPAAPFILLATLVLFLSDWFSPVLASWVAWVLEHFVLLLNGALRLIARLPGQSMEGFFISLSQVLLLYGVLAFFALAFKTGRGRYVFYGLALLLAVQLESGFRQMQQRRAAFFLVYPMGKGKFVLDAVAGGQRLTLYHAQPSSGWELDMLRDFRAYFGLERGCDVQLGHVDSLRMLQMMWKRPFLQLDTFLIFVDEGPPFEGFESEAFGIDTVFFVKGQ